MAERRIHLPHAPSPEREPSLERSRKLSGHNRSIIVIGASAGGIEPLQRIAADLPADLQAAVFVVLHVGQTSYLPGILDRASPLRAWKAENCAT